MNATRLALAGLLIGSTAQAGGIDRSAQQISPLFRDGNYAELSLGYTEPDLTGMDLATGGDIGNVAGEFVLPGFAFKYQFTDQWSVALIGSEDFGADIRYPGDPATTSLGGTTAISDSYALALIGRYKIDDNWSIHAGIRGDRADGEIALSGLAYGRLNGYRVELENDIGFGYLVGGAYERPDIALRLAVTYNSRIRHDFDTTETLGGMPLGAETTTDVDTPQSINVDFQTGIAPDWLLFAGYRWAEWGAFAVEPEVFNDLVGESIVNLDDAQTFTLGVGHQITENWGASVAYVYEPPASDRLVSPLAPSTGLQAVRLGGSYRQESVEVSAVVQYARPGNALPETGTPDTARADFRDNEAWSAGIRFGYSF